MAADFTYDGVAELLGPAAHDALARNETTPALRRTTGGSPLETLTRLFLLQAVGRPRRRGAGAARAGRPARGRGLPRADRRRGRGPARRAARTPPTSDSLWVVSDLTPGLDGGPNRVGPDHVLGISSASTSLAQLTIREPGRPLARPRHRLRRPGAAPRRPQRAPWWRPTSTSGRCGWPGSTSRSTSVRTPVDVRAGSFFEPVAGERFDLIATNPPFVISPATGERLVYRDSGLPGDRVVEHIVRTRPTTSPRAAGARCWPTG